MVSPGAVLSEKARLADQEAEQVPPLNSIKPTLYKSRHLYRVWAPCRNTATEGKIHPPPPLCLS